MSDVHADLTAWLAAPEQFTPEDIQNMAGALLAVLAIHPPEKPGYPSDNTVCCGYCRDSYEEPVPYPCSTVQAIAAAVGVTETRQETKR